MTPSSSLSTFAEEYYNDICDDNSDEWEGES